MKIKAILLAPALVLGGCASEIGQHGGSLAQVHAAFGDAVRHNIAVQTVNPEGSTEPVASSAARSSAAVAAYYADEVEKPRSPGTTDVAQSGDGSDE